MLSLFMMLMKSNLKPIDQNVLSEKSFYHLFILKILLNMILKFILSISSVKCFNIKGKFCRLHLLGAEDMCTRLKFFGQLSVWFGYLQSCPFISIQFMGLITYFDFMCLFLLSNSLKDNEYLLTAPKTKLYTWWTLRIYQRMLFSS